MNSVFQVTDILQNLSRDPVLLPTVEGLGVEHNGGAVAWFGAGDIALPTQLHPRHRQNRPAENHFKTSGAH